MYKLIKQSLLKSPKLFNFIKKYILKHYRNAQLKSTKFPRQVWIENTNHCNAECIICPRELQTRPKGIMSFDIYKKIILEISKYSNKVDRVHMHNFGEPLLDKKLPERIKLAKDYGIKHVYFVTNASLLDSKNSKKLIDSGLDELKISFYGVDHNSYNNTMVNLDFDTTLNNVKTFFNIRKELNSVKPKVILQLIPQNNNDLDFQSKWISLFKGVINESIGDSLLISSLLHNYGGGRSYIDTNKSLAYNVCKHPWDEMVILQDGTVVACCLDYNGSIDLGSVDKNTIYEIWNGDKYNKLRSDFKSLNYNYPACNNCDVPFA